MTEGEGKKGEESCGCHEMEEDSRMREGEGSIERLWFVKVKGRRAGEEREGEEEQMMRRRRGDDPGNVGRFLREESGFVYESNQLTNMLPKPINLELPGETQRH